MTYIYIKCLYSLYKSHYTYYTEKGISLFRLWWGYEDDAIAADKKQRNASFRRLVDLFIGFFIEFQRC